MMDGSLRMMDKVGSMKKNRGYMMGGNGNMRKHRLRILTPRVNMMKHRSYMMEGNGNMKGNRANMIKNREVETVCL